MKVLEIKIRKIFPERVANLINKINESDSRSLFIRFSSLDRNISRVLNTRCINLNITCHKNDSVKCSFDILKGSR